jgi:adenylosuccinate lyase
VPETGIRHLYQLESRWQAWLDVEAALARAQAQLGLIPASAADRIAQVAQLEALNRDAIDAATLRTSHPLVPLVWELARVAGEPAGGWVHWGATTQNIVQTGDALVLRRAHRVFLGLLADCLSSAADLAEAHAETPMAGRTHGQHAVPTTFGFKVATWVDELSRQSERLRQLEGRVFVVLLGGAVGNFAATGPDGVAVQRAVGAALGLTPMPVPARSIADHLAEYVTALGLLAGTVSKIAREIYTLMKTEFGEVEEPLPNGTVGSSTMPQKRNPQLCQDMIASAAQVRAAVSLALEGMQIEHEADRSRSLMLQEATQVACVATGDILARLSVVLAGLKVDAGRMRSNLDLTSGLIMSEAVMMGLAVRLGRQRAHDVVYEAGQRAAVEGLDFGDILRSDPRIQAVLDEQALADSLDPAHHLGQSPALARAAAAWGRRAVAELRQHLAAEMSGDPDD